MGDEYQDLVELGFEGVDRLADKYHDTVYGYAGKHKPHWPRKKRRHSHEQPRARSEPPDERELYSSEEEDRGISTQNKRRERDWRDDSRGNRAYEEDSRRPYPRPDAGVVAVRESDAYGYPGGYQVGPPAYPPPRGYAPLAYHGEDNDDDQWAYERGRPRPARRRSSSWSAPRQSRQQRGTSSSQRSRSKDPNHHIAATLVGAVAGGLLANRVSLGDKIKKGDRLATVAGAVVGGIGARELEKAVWRKKDREAEEEELYQQRREQRRKERERERERDYNY